MRCSTSSFRFSYKLKQELENNFFTTSAGERGKDFQYVVMLKSRNTGSSVHCWWKQTSVFLESRFPICHQTLELCVPFDSVFLLLEIYSRKIF